MSTPLKVAIIGAVLQIHMYDRLWAPHGSVRYGIAPDHPEVKVRYLPSFCNLCSTSISQFKFSREASRKSGYKHRVVVYVVQR